MAIADTGYFGLGKETTAGVAVAPTNFLPVEEVNFEYENEFIEYRPIRGSRQSYGVLDGAIRPQATIRGPLYASKAMGRIWRGLLGANTSALEGDSTTARRFTFNDAGTLPSFSLERSDARSGGGGLLTERIAGCMVERVSLSCAFGEKVDFEATFQALTKPVTASAAASATVNAAYPVEKPMYFKGASVLIDSVANNYFKSLNMEMTNQITRLESLRGSQESYGLSPAGFMCSLSGTMIFSSLSEYNKAIAGTPMEIDIVFTSDTMADSAEDIPYETKLSMPQVKIAKYSIPYVAGDTIEADVDFKVIFDETSGTTVVPSIVNVDLGTAYD